MPVGLLPGVSGVGVRALCATISISVVIGTSIPFS